MRERVKASWVFGFRLGINYADRKSISGFVFRLNGRSVSYASKKQIIVTFLSTKAKYVVLNLAAQETT